MKNRYLADVSQIDWWERLATLFSTLSKPVLELYHGIRKKTVPVHILLPMSLFLQVLICFGVDRYLFRLAGLRAIFPTTFTWYSVYYAGVLTTPFWLWAWTEAMKRIRLENGIKGAFQSIGLQNNLGKLPAFIFDRPLDLFTRKLRVSRAALSKADFDKAKPKIESVLDIYIDEIREERTEGTMDIVYSRKKMPELCRIDNYRQIRSPNFIVGITRAKEIIANLNSCPHLLIAGQTGAGKSTFLRQFITTHYLNDKSCTFTLVDLKDGLDSQLFENRPRITIQNTMEKANDVLNKFAKTVDYRMKVLRANNCKDITQFFKLPKIKRELPSPDSTDVVRGLNRHIIIVDEAAEMFLAGDKTKAAEAQEARRILSKIARQGRSLGVHLVVATQRPDSRALDPQIKANLTGVLCFQMVNDSSSILVLGNGRATDLPPVPGRAIWKSGLQMVEVQTPLLDDEEMKALLDQDQENCTLSPNSGNKNSPTNSSVEDLRPMEKDEHRS